MFFLIRISLAAAGMFPLILSQGAWEECGSVPPVSTPSEVEDGIYILHLSLLLFKPLRNIINLSGTHYSFLISFLVNHTKFNIIRQNSYFWDSFFPYLSEY